MLGQTTTWGVGVKTLHAAIFSDTIKSEQCQLCVMIPLTEVYLFTPHSLSLPVHTALSEVYLFTLHSPSFTCSHPTHRVYLFTPHSPNFTCLHPIYRVYLFTPHTLRLPVLTPLTEVYGVYTPVTEFTCSHPTHRGLRVHTSVTPQSHPSHTQVTPQSPTQLELEDWSPSFPHKQSLQK